MYEEIKNNIIEKFFNRNYRYTVVTCKQRIIDDINERLPFKTISDNSYDNIDIELGDNIVLSFNLYWETKNNGKLTMYKLMKIS